MASTRHTRTIEHDGDEYTLSCSCRTLYRSRIGSYAAAAGLDRAHKAAVADGTWQAEQDADATRAAALAPRHAAQAALFAAQADYRSAGFALIIAKQQGGDVDAARAERTRLAAIVEAAEAAVAATEAGA